jgi:hypothetical protein
MVPRIRQFRLNAACNWKKMSLKRNVEVGECKSAGVGGYRGAMPGYVAVGAND